MSDLGQLLLYYAAVRARVGEHEGTVHCQVATFHQPGGHAATNNLLEHLAKHARLPKASVPVLGERRVVGDLLL